MESGDLKSQILKYLEHLTSSEEYDDDEGFHYWRDGDHKVDSGTCTNASRMVADEFGGEVFGYHVADVGRVGGSSGGHDFALVADRYLVDWWGANFEGSSEPIYDLHDPADRRQVDALYLPRSEWERV